MKRAAVDGNNAAIAASFLLPTPSPAAVRAAREAAGLTQAEAAVLIGAASERGDRTWQNYEAPVAQAGHRPMPAAAWACFLLATGQHPGWRLNRRRS